MSAETHTGQPTATLHTFRLRFLKIKPFCLDLQAVDRGGLSCRMVAMGCGCASGCLAPAQRHPVLATKRHQNKPALATVGQQTKASGVERQDSNLSTVANIRLLSTYRPKTLCRVVTRLNSSLTYPFSRLSDLVDRWMPRHTMYARVASKTPYPANGSRPSIDGSGPS